MIRILITYLAPLVLPALAWYLWNRLAPRRPGTPDRKTGWAAAPWDRLGIAGVVLLALTLGAVALFTGAEPGNLYTPARVVDGKIVPGVQVVEPARDRTAPGD